MPGSLHPVKNKNDKLDKHKTTDASVNPGAMLDALSREARRGEGGEAMAGMEQGVRARAKGTVRSTV